MSQYIVYEGINGIRVSVNVTNNGNVTLSGVTLLVILSDYNGNWLTDGVEFLSSPLAIGQSYTFNPVINKTKIKDIQTCPTCMGCSLEIYAFPSYGGKSYTEAKYILYHCVDIRF